MPDPFHLPSGSAPDPAADKLSVAAGEETEAFARELQARFGPNAVQNVYQPRPSATSTGVGATVGTRPVPIPKLSLPPALTSLPVVTSSSPPVGGARVLSGAVPTHNAFGSAAPTAPKSSSSPDDFRPIMPNSLGPVLSDRQALIIDIRPHAQYSNARLPGAVSLSVPSMLLKRPFFPLERLVEMLTPAARHRLERWPRASRVLVYDADATQINPGSNLHGLLSKFSAAGCSPSVLSWLQGGFQAVWRQHRELIDADSPSDDEDTVENDMDQHPSSALQGRALPLSAFTQKSTTSSNSPDAARWV
jgi:tyrosine-protein phosphatase 2/3